MEPLFYQWYFQGVEIVGATNSTLSLSNVQAGDVGYYAARVTNEVGWAQSARAWLSLLSPQLLPGIDWSPRVGANPRAVALDAAGNAYVTGYFIRSVVQFGTLTVVNSSFAQMFLVKYDPSGNPVWVAQSSGSGVGWGFGVAVDRGGNIYVGGSFYDTTHFGTNSFTSANPGQDDLFLAKYDFLGRLLWVRTAGGTNNDRIMAVAVDAAGNCFVTGYFGSQLTLGSVTLDGSDSQSLQSGFIAAFDTRGTPLWAAKIPGARIGNSLALGRASNCYLTGHAREPFVAKYSASGTQQWMLVSPDGGGGALDAGLGIAVDQRDNIYITGGTFGRVTFGSNSISYDGRPGPFLARFNSAGTSQWLEAVGGNAVATDDFGYLYLAGSPRFQDGPVFAAKLDPSGVTQWNIHLGASWPDTAPAIAVDRSGNAVVLEQIGDETLITKLGDRSVLAPAAVRAQPQSSYTNLGSSVVFLPECTGTGPLYYQWRFNGSDLLNATNGALVLTSVGPAEQGEYSLVVTNHYGSDTSRVATVTLQLVPILTTQPQSQTVIAGTNVTFRAAANGALPLFYQWQFNGTNIPGALSTNLVVSNAQPAHAGAYTLVVTNGFSSVTSAVAMLTVNLSLAVAISGNGSVTRVPNQVTFSPGSIVTLTATPNPGGFGFASWMGTLASSENPLRLVMTTNHSLAAVFVSTALAALVQGQGSVAKVPDKPFYQMGEAVTLTATPFRWMAFQGWSDGSTANPRVVTIGASNSYTAIFIPTTAVETLTFSNVSRLAPVGMPAIFVDAEFVSTNVVSRLNTASLSMFSTFPNGSLFYTLDGQAPDFGARLYTAPFILRHSATVRAVAYDAGFLTSWEADPLEVIIEPTFAVEVSTPGGGTVGVSPAAATYRSNTLVTLTATPAPGWTFLKWLGDAASENQSVNIRVRDRDVCALALFGTPVETSLVGGGAVRVDPAVALYPYGTVLCLTAIPHVGSYFAAWGNAAVNTGNPLFFTVTNSNPTVSCAFGALSPGQASLTVVMNGFGRVRTSPGGNRFPIGQALLLTALPNAGQEFLGWNSGSGSTNLPVLLSASMEVTANFSKNPTLSLGPCRPILPTSEFPLTLLGEFGARYQLQRSADFFRWGTFVHLTNLDGVTQFIDAGMTNEAARFYRAVKEP